VAGVFVFWVASLLLFDSGEEKPLTEAFWAGTWVVGLAAAAAGAVLGMTQYSVLRRSVPNARLWGIVNAAAWAFSLTAGAGLFDYYVLHALFPGRLFYWGAVFSAVYGYGPAPERILSVVLVVMLQAVITGSVLVRLLSGTRARLYSE
jgi:hypothetical protein